WRQVIQINDRWILMRRSILSILAGIVAGFLTFLVVGIMYREISEGQFEILLGMDRNGTSYTIRLPLSEIGLREVGQDTNDDGRRDMWTIEAQSSTQFELVYHYR